jgi:lysophospholipase L1-like esterase
VLEERVTDDRSWADESSYRFDHVDKLVLPVRLPLTPPQAAQAALLGANAEVYAQVREHCEAVVARTAQELAQVSAIRSLTDRLALPSSTRLLFAGDSRTDEWQSWRAILVALLALARPDVKLRFVDVSMASATTSEGFSRVAHLPLSVRPHWMFIMLGINDSMRFTGAPEDRLVTLEGTQHALTGMLRWARSRGVPHDPIWLTPGCLRPDVDPSEGFVQGQQDVDEVDAIVRTMPGTVVDCTAALSDVEDPLMADGRHFTLAGQRAIACAVLAAWAGGA